MRQILAKKLNRALYTFVAMALILQSVLPISYLGLSPALADSQSYPFTTAGNYDVDTNVEVVDDVAMFHFTWDTSNVIQANDAVVDLLSADVGGVLLATTNKGTVLRSTDYGDNWATSVPSATYRATELVQTTANDVVVVGVDVGVTNLYYSTDNGATWNASTSVFAGHSFSAVTYDSVGARVWAADAGSGVIYESSDGGDIWAPLAQPTGLDTTNDIVWYGGNVIVAVGERGGAGAISYTPDAGATWFDLVPPDNPVVALTVIERFGNTLLVGGSGYVAGINLGAPGGTHDYTDPNDWTNYSSNINSGRFTTVGGFYQTTDGMLFVSLLQDVSAEARLYTSIDGGTDWHGQGEPTGFISPGDVVRMYTDGGILWGASNSLAGNSAVGLISEYYDVSDSLVTNVGVSGVSIDSVSITYHATSEVTDIGIALGFSSDDAGTWYYYTGGAWTSTVTDEVSNSNTETVLNANLATFDTSTGDVYFKLYMHRSPFSPESIINSYDFVVIESMSVTYTTGTLELTVPDDGTQSWSIGTTQDIQWNSTGFSTVDLYYSIDSGSNWTLISAGETTNDGSNVYPWFIPDEAVTIRARIKVANGGVSDYSAKDFIIYDPDDGGGGEVIDVLPPESWVDPNDLLPEYSPGTFTIQVEAHDEVGGSGVDEVYLWYSFNQEPGPFIGEVTLAGTQSSGGPGGIFTFEFTAPQDGAYYFVSSAIDFKDNDNAPTKPINLDPPDEDGGYPGCKPPLCWPIMPAPPAIEAQTIVDSTLPYITAQQPAYNEENVPLDGNVIANFSESMATDTFTYQLLRGLPGQPGAQDATDKLGSSTWTLGNSKVTISYSELDQDQWYTFKILTLTDEAGNNLAYDGNPLSPPLATQWAFKTTIIQNPDLTGSSISVTNEQQWGFRPTQDTVAYRVTLTNDSNLPAYVASADLTFTSGLHSDNTLSASSGQATFSVDGNGQITGWTWLGSVYQGQPVYINFGADIDIPANELSITQSVTIDDGVNGAFEKSTTITVRECTSFDTASKTVDKNTAAPSDVLHYTVTATNIGTTAGWVDISDSIPAGTSYVTDSLTGTGWDSLEYSSSQNAIWAHKDLTLVDESLSFSFAVVIGEDTTGTITNTAVITSAALSGTPLPPATKSVSAQTSVEFIPPPGNPPELISQSPLDGAQAVGLTQPIQAQFNKVMNPYSFEYAVSMFGQAINTSSWNVTWDAGSKAVTITPPYDWDIDTTYEVEIITAQDLNGNQFVPGSFSNPWTFTTIYPTVKIVTPDTDPKMLVNTTKAYNQSTGKYEDLQFFVGLRDFYTNAVYVAEENISVDFDLSSARGAVGLSAGFTDQGVASVTILAGQSETGFYYRDDAVSAPDWASITPFEDPFRGWADETKYVQVVSEDEYQLEPHLNFTISSRTVTAGILSGPITISAQDSTQYAPLPARLFFHTQSTAGTFFVMQSDGQLAELPEWATIQSNNPTSNLQYYNVEGGLQHFATFYYMDNAAGSPVVTVADNAPLAPDIGYNNVSTVLSVVALTPEELELEEELEEVEDETGRIITSVEIDPTETTLLPNGVQSFSAKGYDQEGQEIEELRFKWYVLAGGGTVQKNGLGGNSHVSAFVADDTPGIYYDTVMVATLYNGKIDYATASVYIVDIAGVGGPTALPVTGVSGLQLIFMGLTLAAAVALAWVESYEKQHFSQEHK
ncbi:MAG: Ig-like domain-containing protein [Patescibacteria group bacterium]|nr:Ig-like domain-containing protein [Patescibacteria group bacterium]